MIEACNKNFAKNASRWGIGPFACRVISLYNSYPPPLAFVDYWTLNTDGVCTGVAARNGTDFILLLSERTDVDEVCAFLCAVGAKRVICDARYNLNLPEYLQTDGYILKKAETYGGDCGADFCVPNLKEAYALLKKCEGINFRVPEFENFYVDMNHRLRHGTSRICGVECEKKLAAVGMTTAECEDSAVLGAVCCLPEFRRRGLASVVVKRLVNGLINESKTVYLHRAKDENREFYGSLGFEPCGMWREYFLN